MSNLNPQVQQGLATALAVSEMAQPAVAIANPQAGMVLAVANAAAQYVAASQVMHGNENPAQLAQDWATATAAVAAAAAKFNAAHPAAGAIVAAADAAPGTPTAA